LLLKEQYAHFLGDPALLAARLAPLAQLYGNETIARWNAAGQAGDFDALIDELLLRHYDPIYARSIRRNFPRFTDAIRVAPSGIDSESFRALARDLAQRMNAPSSPLFMEIPS
jgi:tRNA 2-selenouridine synthase